jgi:hypothetical protein
MAGHHSLRVHPHTLQLNVLNGWKDIASYLGKGVRTVQRYERECQLPVRRLPGKTRKFVIAYEIDLQQWVSAIPTRLPDRESWSSPVPRDLNIGIFELYRHCAAGNDLQEAIKMQCAALKFSIEAVVEALSGSDPRWKTERHRTIAAEQKARASEMIETARKMSDRAIEMRSQTGNTIVGRFRSVHVNV